ncbi:PREDICTED: uncharacterized protein LOC105461445 [Wasmannia auropunctata]|uniref:uncharacterized protein LOC105461445 n=1 Tax=Wasmannia auropunctata TaxID=64793 RepID=UPI0005EE1B63|nr:PREDICTED: uncharacterized protein LOC105461445 [Wasmannia auropunctata]
MEKNSVKKHRKHLPMIEIQTNLRGDKDPIPQDNIGDLILNAFKSRPNFVGQVDVETEERLTFQQMRENSVKCALWLKKVGIKKGDVITICTRNLSTVYTPFLASIYIGAIVNPWEEKYFEDIIRVMYFLVINEPDLIFVDHDHFFELLSAIAILKSIKKIIKIVTIGESKSSIKFNSLEAILNYDFDKDEVDKFSCEKNDIMDTAIRTFSSTALNYPGQVNVPYVAFVSPSNRQTPVMSPGDIGLWYESLCWTHSPLLTVHSILSYVTAIKPVVFSEENLFKTIEKYKVTWVFLESSTCNQLIQTDAFFMCDISSLKTLLFDNWEIKKDIHGSLLALLSDVSVVRVYSKPEIGVIAYQRKNDAREQFAGHVAKNVQLAFITKNMKQLGPNQTGLICYRSPYTIYGDKHKIKEPWCYLKDKGFYNENGEIFIIIDGFHHFVRYKKTIIIPKSIETTLKYHPSVSEAIVTAVQHPIDMQHPVAYIKTKPGLQVTKQDLMEFMKEEAPDECQLRGGVHFIKNEIPRLPNGKIYRRLFWTKINDMKSCRGAKTCRACCDTSGASQYSCDKMASQSSRNVKNVLAGEEEPIHNVNIGNMILSTFKSDPDFIGQIDAATGEQITFQQMRENSVKCALWLQQTFINSTKDIVISICTRNQMLAYIPCLAGLYVGAIVNGWNEKYFEDMPRAMWYLVEFQSDIIFVDNDNYKILDSAIKLLNTREAIESPPIIVTIRKLGNGVNSLESILNSDFSKDKIKKFSCEEVKPMNIMATMFPSNATQYLNSRTNVRYYALTYPSNQEVPAMSPGDIGLWYGSLSWFYSLLLIVRSIVSHVTAIKCSKFSDENLYEIIEKYKVSWVFLESDMCNQLFETNICMYDVSSLKQFIFGDSVINYEIHKDLIKYFKNASIIQVYSIADSGIIAAYQRNNQIGSHGKVAKNIQLMITNTGTKEPVGPKLHGEIWYKLMCKWCNAETCESPNCSNYQAKKDTITKEKDNTTEEKDNVNNNIASAAVTSTWHCTGDYGYYEKDSEIYVIDRLKALIKYKTFYVSPTIIENLLLRHPAVSEVVVRSVPNSADRQHPVAYVKRICGAEVKNKDLVKFVEDNLPDMYKLRGGLHFKTKMPHLPNGKIDRMLVHRY